MIFSKRYALSMFAALSLASFAAFGCDSDDNDTDDGGNKPSQGTTSDNDIPNCNAGKQGYSPSCKCIEDETDWTKSGKSSIVDYLVGICKLSTNYQDQAFQNATADQQGIGASCFCYGPKCNYAGYERPELQQANNDAILFGCDGVAADDPSHMYNGAIRSCFRSTHIDDIKPAIYFPGGACALTMSKCTPSDECVPSIDGDSCTPEDARKKNEKTICGFAKFGDYSQLDTFTSCPNDEVLMDFVMNIEITSLGRKAKLDVRGCFKGCNTDADCHDVNTYDPITSEMSQYKCVETEAAASGEHAGKVAKVCFDKRTIQNSEGGLMLVNPGKYEVAK